MFAFASVALGIAALAIGLAQPTGSTGGRGFMITTFGVTAMIVGWEAVRRARWGRRATRVFGRIGFTSGAIGTGLMAYALVAYLLAFAGLDLPSLSIASHGMGSVASSITGIPAAQAQPRTLPRAVSTPPVTVPTPAPAPVGGQTNVDPWVPMTPAAERDLVWQAVGSLAYVMRQDFGSGPFPATLETESASPERVTLPTGVGLAPAPNGAQVIYSRASDGMSWSVTVIGASFGQRATYSSISNMIQ